MSRGWQSILILAVPLVVGTLFRNDAYVVSLLVFVLLNGVLAMGTTLCMGHAGQITLAQAGFYAIGAYTAAAFSQRLGLPMGVGLVAAIAVSFLVGYVLSFPIMRLRGHYLALITLAFTMVVAEIATHWTAVTGGASGLYGMKRPSIPQLDLDPLFEFMLFVAAYWFVVYLALQNLVASRYGRAMHGLKYTEAGAQSCGVDVRGVKTTAFAISAAVMGGGGAFYAFFIQYVGPESFPIELSITIVAMCILGGMTDLRGAVIGSALLSLANEPLRDYPVYQPLFYSLIIIATIIFLPHGIVPSLIRGWRNRATRRRLDATATIR